MAKIREMLEDDVAVVASMLMKSELWSRLGETQETVPLALHDSIHRLKISVAEENDEVSGAVCYVPGRIIAGASCLSFLVVREEKRGRGIGRQLMGFVERKVFAKADGLVVSVSSANEAALRFFSRLGYERVGEVSGSCGFPASELILRKAAPGKIRPSTKPSPLADVVSPAAK